MRSHRCLRRASLALFTAALASCDDAIAPLTPPVTRTITVDASAAFAFVALDTVAETVTVTAPSASSAWDMGFFSTSVMLNGGAAGPSDVAAFCLCQNEGASDAAAQADTDRAWIIREGTAVILLTKFQVTAISGASTAGPTSLTFAYARQDAPGGDFGAVVTGTINPAAAPVYIDLTTGSVTDASNWDLRFDGWQITVNGGVSGSGNIRAVVDVSTPFASITAAYAGTVPGQAYRADRYSGEFLSRPWYRYNITGSDNQIWPTFQVYLVRRGSAVYKVQLTGYYGATGTPRQITVRYALLTN